MAGGRAQPPHPGRTHGRGGHRCESPDLRIAPGRGSERSGDRRVQHRLHGSGTDLRSNHRPRVRKDGGLPCRTRHHRGQHRPRGAVGHGGSEVNETKRRWERIAPRLSFSNISAIYVLLALVVIFTLWKGELFFSYATFVSILNDNAIACLMALALVVPLACKVFDLSIGYTMGVASVLLAWLVGPKGFDAATAIVITLLVGVAIGAVNAAVVILWSIDSFIATLATGSILQAVIIIITDNQSISEGVSAKLNGLVSTRLADITLPVFIALAVVIVMWYVLGHTAVGRSVYATGLNEEAARLAGVRVKVIQSAALIISATTAALAGVLVTAVLGSGSPTVGPPYLIPAFAAVFLGATQFRGGLFNPVGTAVAIILLGTVSYGLALAGVPLWTPYVFQGLVLIGALALGGLQKKARVRANTEPDDHDSQSASPDETNTHNEQPEPALLDR
ncbi:hypothetical protein ACN94_20910 [Gordonia paraffinivorans]|nr:hypothetical protein [Gordonia paraffinivorans]